jgi:hypothetical protein
MKNKIIDPYLDYLHNERHVVKPAAQATAKTAKDVYKLNKKAASYIKKGLMLPVELGKGVVRAAQISGELVGKRDVRIKKRKKEEARREASRKKFRADVTTGVKKHAPKAVAAGLIGVAAHQMYKKYKKYKKEKKSEKSEE